MRKNFEAEAAPSAGAAPRRSLPQLPEGAVLIKSAKRIAHMSRRLGHGLWPDRMAYAALLSGLTLAQTGLGSVHGLAAPLGAFFPIPHGVACGTLVAAATALNIRALRARLPGSPGLARYERAAEILCGRVFPDRDSAHAALVDELWRWTNEMGLARLGAFGMAEADVDRVVASARGSSMKTNPVVLTDTEIAGLLRERF